MAATALAQETVWLDKSFYDKAECLFYEKAAKLGTYCKMVSRKNVDQCLHNTNSSSPAEQQSLKNINKQSKSKPKKSKDNKVLEASSENTQNAKNQTKNVKSSKKREEPALNREEVVENEIKQIKEPEVSSNTNGKKYKVKEAKEKKNKADKKHKNKEEDKVNLEESKDKLLSQGNQESTCSVLPTTGGSLANEVAKARQHIKQSLQCIDGIVAMAVPSSQDVSSRVTFLEKENKELRTLVGELKTTVAKLDKRVLELETPTPHLAVCPAKPNDEKATSQANDEDDVDLFGSDSEGEDAEAAKIREERLAAYNAKKSKKPTLIAKSNIILDVKPWDDETDMKALEAEVRKIKTEGLLWGAAKLVPLAYGIHKLQISCVVEDEKVSVDWLTEQIQDNEEYVQSVDIAAFNKV